MSFFESLFPPEKKRPSPSIFERWERPPQVCEIPAGKEPLSALPAGRQAISAAFGPSLMIGLGAAGRAALEQWLKQTSHYEAESFRRARLLVISQESLPPLPSSEARIYYLSFGDVAAQGKNSLDAFMQAVNLRRFNDWMRANMLDLRDFQILIIGSVAEPEIQTLGALLQLLRSFLAENSVAFLNIVGLLSLSPVEKQKSLSPGERYAALRETGRFTFNGTHKLAKIPHANLTAVSSALLDHLFLFDESAFQKHGKLENGIAQALGEILFFLCHPSSRVFWEALKNNPAGELRKRHYQPFINAVGVKTFFLPLLEMQNYLAARLARAVLFGERAQDAAERFVSNAPLGNEDLRFAESLARRWLNERGPGYHPVFEWVLTAQETTRTFPNLDADYHDLYAYKIAHALLKFLNETNQEGKLRLAELAFDAHVQIFDKLLSLAQNASADNFCYTIRIWKKAAEALRHALQQWQKTFLFESSPDVSENARPAGLQSTWKIKPSDLSALQDELAVNDFLLRRLKEAENALKNISGGQALFPLTHNGYSSLTETEKYYEENVRPELLHLGLPASPAFRTVRKRLEWWVRLIPSRDPELMVVCWDASASVEPQSQPPYEMCFFHEDKQKLAEAVFAISSTQFSKYDELTGDWYLSRLKESSDRIAGRADEVFLAYDEDESAKFGGALRRYYIAAKTKTFITPFIGKLLPLQPEDNVQEIDNYDPTRFSVLTTCYGLPFSALRALQNWYEDYSHAPYFHTYPPEKNAAMYEDRYFRLFGTRVFFPPVFVIALADAQMVTLFCQALICKLIYLQENGLGNPPIWQISAAGDFPSLPLTEDDSPDSLFYAFRKFTLELPNDPNVNLNPHNHFHPNRRAAFLETLFRKAQMIRKGEEFKRLKSEFRNGVLAEWAKRKDPLALAFLAVLQVELEEPVWETWHS